VTRCSAYIASSIDGFIAGPDGGIEWLHRPAYAPSPELGLTYKKFISTVDALVMGRNSFTTVSSFKQWPYEGTPVVVLTGRAVEIPGPLQGKVRVDGGRPQDIVARLAAVGCRHLYVDGGNTIQRFLQARLINEIAITRIPILLGGGIQLFGALGVELPLRLLGTAVVGDGLVQDRYEVVYPADGRARGRTG